MYKLIILFILSYFVVVNATVMQEGEFIKEKQELIKLKKELDEFYKIKELEYDKNKKELNSINEDIKKQVDSIKKIEAANQKILDEIKQTIVSKAMKLYAKMKPKLVKAILQKKIDAGEINDVFDIMVRLKEKRVMKLLKMFDTDTSTQLMDMISEYKSKPKEEI